MKAPNLVLLMLLLLIANNTTAQSVQSVSMAGNQNTFTCVEPPQIYLYRNQLGKIATADFQVDYDINVPTAARTAFDKAIDIWKYLIVLSKTVKIKVTFVNEPNSGMLGSTGVETWRNNYNDFPFDDIQYPISLAKHLDHSISYNDYDIDMVFNSAQNFNYETNGIPVENKFDFITVALHEIGHGLGLAGSFYVDQNYGYFGLNDYPLVTTGTYPTISDKFYVSGPIRLINVSNPNILGNLLVSDDVYFDGTNAKALNNNQNVKLFAPAEWSNSSIDHLDENTFPPGNQNSLMTPYIDMAEVNHNPGEIFLGMLRDYGHTVSRIINFIKPAASNQLVKGQNYNITWSDNISDFGDYINFELYKITSGDPVFVETINHNEPVWSNPGSSGNSFEWEVLNSYENNFYFLRAVGTNNSVDYGQSNVFVISNVPEAPHFNPPGSQYAGAQSVQLYTTTPVSEIRYVIGNSEPNQNSTLYTTLPISVPNSMRIRAKSFLVLADNTVVASPVSDAYYFIGSNSFVMEKLTNTNEYGWIYRRLQGGVYNYNHDYNELKVGFKPPAPDYNNVYRSYAKWTGFRTIIPSGSIIQSVEFEIPFNPSNSSASIEFRYYSPLPGSDWPQKWDHIGEGTPVATMPANSSVFNVQEFVSYIQNVVNGSGNDYFGIGIKNANENNSSDFVNFIDPVKIKVYYRGNVEVTQLDKDNDPFGQVGYWNGTYWDGKNVPATFFKTNNITLKSDQDWYSSNQKYYNWLDQTDVVNHYTFSIGTGVNYFTAQFDEVSQTPKVKNSYELSTIDPQGDNIWFKDPWLVDELDGVYGMRNQGMSGGNQGDPGADWYEKNSPIDFSLPDFANYKGVFLNQPYTGNNPVYYSVKAELTQDLTLYNTGNPSGRNHHFIFQNWSGTNVAFEDANARGTGVVFTDINAVANANYKGTQLSNNQNAFSNQRKFIRTYDQQYYTTRFHLVYESMNKVWYERSTDGINWEIMNNGQPIYEGIGKHPSIDALPGTHNVIIVYNKDEWVIAAQYYQDGIFKFESIVCDNGWVMGNAKPVIACAYARFLVAWDDNSGDINYRFGQLCTQTLPPGYYFHWYFDYKVVTYSPNTIKSNVTIAAAIRTSDYKSYWLAWDSNQLAIQVVNLKTTDDVNFQESQTFTFDQSGFSKNYKPSIIVWKNGNETYDRVRVSWIARRFMCVEQQCNEIDGSEGGGEDPPEGDGSGSFYEYKTFFRCYDDGVWSAYNSYGGNVTSVSINKNSDNSFAFAWSEGDGVANKFIRSDNLTNIRTQNTNGKYLQIGNYANLNSMRLMSFKTSTPPYYFLLSNAFNWIPPQQIEPPIADREGVITKDTTSLYFSIGEITVDGEKINFVELPDTLIINGREVLNTYLISEQFNLTENTFFTYGVQYGVTDSLSAAMALTEGKSVSFRVELIDEQTNEVLGTFDDVTFSEGSIIPYESIAYHVNTEGIGNRICRLRLVIDDNLNPDYSLTNDYNGEAVLSKQGFVERTLNVNEIVKTYDLEQNYPNPFNPATTIRYQLPKEGLVTLKVYDILGSEVATLVNEQKTTGKYEANFNASKFASGVYIYRLSVNDFVNVKKMVLLK